MFKKFFIIACIMNVFCFVPAVSAETLKIIISHAPGSGPDIITRTVGKFLEKKLNISVVVENKPFFTGHKTFTEISKTDDTILSATRSTDMLFYEDDIKIKFDLLEETIPITGILYDSNILITNIKYNNFDDFIKKGKETELLCGQLAPKATGYYNSELIKKEYKIIIKPVLYTNKLTNLLLDVAAERLDCGFVNRSTALGFNTNNMIKLYENRHIDSWHGFFAHKTMPKEKILQIEKTLEEIKKDPDFIDYINKLHNIVFPELSNEKFKQYIINERKNIQ